MKLPQEVNVFVWILVDVFFSFYSLQDDFFLTLTSPHRLRGMHIFNASIQCMPSWLLALTLLPLDADVATCNAFLSKCVGAWEVALAVIKMMQEESLADLISYSTVISNLDLEAVFSGSAVPGSLFKIQIARQKVGESKLTFGSFLHTP